MRWEVHRQRRTKGFLQRNAWCFFPGNCNSFPWMWTGLEQVQLWCFCVHPCTMYWQFCFALFCRLPFLHISSREEYLHKVCHLHLFKAVWTLPHIICQNVFPLLGSYKVLGTCPCLPCAYWSSHLVAQEGNFCRFLRRRFEFHWAFWVIELLYISLYNEGFWTIKAFRSWVG